MMNFEDIWRVIDSVFLIYQSLGDSVYSFYISYSRLTLDYIHVFFDSIFYVLLYVTIVLTLSYLIMGVILLFWKNPKKEYKFDSRNVPFVTIQIPTYNELAALNCARRCLDFDYPKDRFVIMIGDDSNKKDVSAKIDEFAKKHSNVVVTRRGLNIGFKPGNLNFMLKNTKGDYIVIFDSDFLPKKDFLKRIIAPFQHDKNVSAVQARWITKNYSQNLVSVVGGTIPLLTHYLGLPFLNRVKGNGFIAGSAEAIKKSDLDRLGGWKSGCLTEDIEYSLRLTVENKRIIYLEDLHCECEAPFTLKDLGKQQMRWAYGVISAIKEHMNILFSGSFRLIDRLNVYLLLSGYLITFLFFILGITGALSIITHRPGAIDWIKFVSETTLNIILTSGFLLTTAVTLVLAGKFKEIPRMLFASFTVGLVVINLVTLGIFKAMFNRPMQWFMLNKSGNLVKH